jgi:hypothetical protein
MATIPRPAETPSACGPSRRRNRMLAVLLASVAASAFTTVIILAELVHYAEAHHLLSSL